jgi:hypothetical protein
MYAVYDFLERYCDIRWFNPTEVGMDCPKKETLAISNGKDIRRNPFIISRLIYDSMYIVENYDTNIGLWKKDTVGYQEYDQKAYPQLHSLFPNEGDYLIRKKCIQRLYYYRMRVGGKLWTAGHSLYSYYDRFHESEPDWFVDDSTSSQLCYTNPEVINQVVQDARDYFDKGGYPANPGPGLYPGYMWGEDCFAVEPLDSGNFCQCPLCRKFYYPTDEDSKFFSNRVHSDYIFNFVNAVAREVRKTHPDKWIITLAYMSHAGVPKNVVLEPKVAVAFCFATTRGFYNVQQHEHELKYLAEWHQTYPDKPLNLWLYYTFPKEAADNGLFNCFPGFFAHTIDKQFKLFHQYDIKGIFHCGYGQEVEAYVTNKLMDDPTLDTEKLLDEYFTRLYGQAAAPMKQLYCAIEDTYSNPQNWPAGPVPWDVGWETQKSAWGYLGTRERIAEFANLLQRAKELAQTQIERQRIELFEKGVWSYMVAGKAKYTRDVSVGGESALPVLPDIGNKSVKEGELLTIQFQDADNLTYSATGLPSGATLNGSTFSWRPNYTQAGSYKVTFGVSDSRGGTDSKEITITVYDSTYTYGDVSGDGEISAYDAALTAQAAVGLINLTANQAKAADVSGDSKVTAYDAALIAQKAVGLIDKFPVTRDNNDKKRIRHKIYNNIKLGIDFNSLIYSRLSLRL